MKTILLATDGSEPAEYAAEFLAHVHYNQEFTLLVASVIAIPSAAATTVNARWKELSIAESRKQAAASFEKIHSLFDGANIDVKQIVKEGDASATICGIARDHCCDLVVVGDKGHSAVSRILLGSTSDYIATHAPCSVLVVRPRPVGGSTESVRIALGYEETAPSQATVKEIAEVNWGKRVDLRLVSVATSEESIPYFAAEQADAARRSAEQELAGTGASTRWALEMNEHVGDGLVGYAAEHHCDLVAIGETPRTALGRALMGSTTRYVLRKAPCSVWIARNRIIREAQATLAAERTLHNT